MTKEKQEEFNKHLADKYGRFVDGRAKYRLTWSSKEFEYRRGDFGKGFIITEENKVKLVEKYNYCLDRWILEKLVVIDNMPKDLVSVSNVSYEPLYVFWTGENGDYEEPTIEQIERRLFFDIYGSLRGHAPTEKKIKEAEEKKRAANIASIREKLDNEIPDTVHALVHGSAVFLDSRKKLKDASETTS